MPVISTTVIARNDFGRFVAEMEGRITRGIEDAIEQGAELSRGMAPVGEKPDYRTVPLKDSISTEMKSSTSGVWKSTARHAAPVEFGAGPHLITGQVRFWWDAEGRWWVPGQNFINHPGNRAQPFIRPAYEDIKNRFADIMRVHTYR
jgi:hypothetical protein